MVLGDSTPQSLSEIVKTGKVVGLDSLLSAPGSSLSKSSFTPGMLSTGTIDGKVYSLPTDGGDYGLVYNKQMFAAAGISAAPTTWAQVAADAAKLTKKGTYGIYLPIGNGEWTVFTWESMLWSAGGQLLNPADNTVEFDSPAGVKALTTWTSLLKNKLAYPQSLASPSDGQGISSLSARKVAMVITGAYNLGTLDTALGKDNVGTAPLPALSEPAMNLGTDNSYILKGTAAQEAGSWAFLQYWLKPSTQAAWDIATGYLPTNQATATDPAFKSYLAQNPRLQPFVQELSYAKARPSILAYAAMSTALGNQLERAMLLQVSPTAALTTAAKGAQTALMSGS
jgi:multiple sugar transport system substrate-binding protein